MKKERKLREMTKEIKAIIWDIGGVIFLAKDKSKRTSKNLHTSIRELWILLKNIDINNEEMFKQFKEIYFKSSIGEVSKEETLNSLSRVLNISIDKVNKTVQGAYKKNTIDNKILIKFILKLKNKGYKQGILSIQWSINKEILISKKYYSLFNESVISCIDKVKKPTPEAFQLILKKMNAIPEQTIFIDDKQENLDAAKSLGINTVLFTNNQELKKEFVKLGVK
jgi:epoxide hydrolase-like predicted phosphatase